MSGFDLYDAAANGDVDKVMRLLKGGVDVNWQDKSGETPLYTAARSGHTEAIKALLGGGAKVDMVCMMTETPLFIAALCGHTEAIKALLGGGAKVDMADKAGWTALCIAAEYGHTNAIKALLGGGAKVDLARSDGTTALYSAAWHGHSEAVNLLLAAGATITAEMKEDDEVMALIQPFLTAQEASSSMGKLSVASSSSAAATVCFSARTNQIPFVQKVVAALKVKGISSYYQNDISKTGPDWDSQWMIAADGAKKIVCILTVDYPASKPCCEEFGVAKDDGKLVVVYKDNIDTIKVAPATTFNGKVKMYVKNNGQGLIPDVAEIVADLQKVL